MEDNNVKDLIEKCPLCGDKGFVTEEQEPEEGTPVDTIPALVKSRCPVKGCWHGMFSVRHRECKGKGCKSCSTVQDHGVAGKVLCPSCKGKKCNTCRNTGLLRLKCNVCKGTGCIYTPHPVTVKHMVTKPCQCVQGKTKKKTTMSVAMEAAIEAS